MFKSQTLVQYYEKKGIIARGIDKKYYFYLYNFECPKIIRIFDRMYSSKKWI